MAIPLLFSQTEGKTLLASNAKKEKATSVLVHYKETGEKEKYQAALFLIKNMVVHKSVNYEWLDAADQKVAYSELNYSNLETALVAFKHLKDSIKIHPKQFTQSDTSVITPALLIKNIDLAFLQWKTNLWSKNYDFDTFCEYILPYRSLIEPLQDWRENYQALLKSVKDEIEDPTDPVEACSLILTEMKGFQFLENRPDPIPLLGPNQLIFRKQGSCPDLANAALFANRALGVAVSFDFTPHYAASSNRHFWNSVIDAQGKHIPFNGVNNGNGLPYMYSPNFKRFAKVFRSTYSIQTTSLAFQYTEEEIPDSFLKRTTILDATHEYLPVGSFAYTFQKQGPKVAYLNVYNKGKWRAIDWAELKNNKTVFKNLGRKVVYLPGIYKEGKMLFEKHPILLTADGKKTVLAPNKTSFFACDLSRLNEKKMDYKENNSLEIIDRKEYALYVWYKRWMRIGTATAEGKSLYFKRIPKGGLYKIHPKKKDHFERIFTINPETCEISWY